MAKILDYTSFSKSLDTELTWRRREISDLKRAIQDAPAVSRQSLLRAFMPVLYAHWEGFSICACKLYFKFITTRRLKVSELSPHFGSLVFLKRFNSLSAANAPVAERLRVLNDIRASGDFRFSRLPDELIETGANLNSIRMRALCVLCGISPKFPEHSDDLIDTQILKRRNQIAHGEWSSIGENELEKITEDLFNLITTFRNELENSIVEERYRNQA